MPTKKTLAQRSFWFILGLVVVLGITMFTRFYHVTQFPPALYWEEIALGYDAYSVLKTGKDFLGNTPQLVSFESFGDYKPALYFYLLMPFLAVFGLNEFSVRLPAMIAGVLLVIGTGLLARFLWQGKDNEKKLFQLLVMLVTAISPWAIQFSRAAWEVNVATTFIVWGVLFGLWAKEKRFVVNGAVSFLLFALSMYTYHSARLISPLLALGMLMLWVQEKGVVLSHFHSLTLTLQKYKQFLLKSFSLGIFFLLIITPILIALRDPVTKQRFAETNLFADGHVVKLSNALREEGGNTLAAKFFTHRYYLYTKEFVENYLKHFEFQFLFVSGDQNPRHSVQYFGQLYIVESIFIFMGIAALLRQRRKEVLYLFFWFLVGIVPAALTKDTPHALRILPVLPVYMIFIGWGIIWLGKWLGSRRSLLYGSAIILLYLIQFGAFWRFYSIVYPKMHSTSWQYGYKQVVAEVNKRKSAFEHVFVTREMDRPAIAYWFFSQTDPKEVQKIDKLLKRESGPYVQFENITFVNFETDARPGLVASSVEALARLEQGGRKVKNRVDILNPAGKAIWAVYELE